MRNSKSETKSKFTIIDFLMVIAMLMILAGLIGPHFAPSHGKTNPASSNPPAVSVRPAR